MDAQVATCLSTHMMRKASTRSSTSSLCRSMTVFHQNVNPILLSASKAPFDPQNACSNAPRPRQRRPKFACYPHFFESFRATKATSSNACCCFRHFWKSLLHVDRTTRS